MKKIICTLFMFFVLSFLLPPGNLGILNASEDGGSIASRNFQAFQDVEYLTSPDKRIGAKILVDPANVGPSISSLVHLTYLPGARVRSRRHIYVTEVIHVLEGNLTLRIADEIKVMGAGSTAYIPPKSFHEYLNDSTDVVKFLQYFSPAGPEEEYKNWAKASEPKPSKVVEEKSKTEVIVSPPLPTVRGSPATVIDTPTQ